MPNVSRFEKAAKAVTAQWRAEMERQKAEEREAARLAEEQRQREEAVAGFGAWRDSIAEETGRPPAEVEEAAMGRTSDDPAEAVPGVHTDDWTGQSQLRLFDPAQESAEVPVSAALIDARLVDKKIDAYLSDRGCTLWGEQWTITDRRGKRNAHLFLRKVIAEMFDLELPEFPEPKR